MTWLHPPRTHRQPFLSRTWVKALAAVVIATVLYVVISAIADKAITQATYDAVNSEGISQ